MNNRYYGRKENYAPVRQDRSAIYISYGKEDVDDVYCTWYEVCYYKKQHPQLTIQQIKHDVIADINAQTDEKILCGFVWEGKSVWLSSENQFNFKAAYDLAVQTKGKSLHVKFKIGETAEGEPVYHTFEDIEEFTDFYTKAIAFINTCLNEGWELKDSIDWSDYEAYFPISEQL